MKRFAYIDALRGYAILGVLLVHTGQYCGFDIPGTAFGARGVQLFFVASALTLMFSWHERRDGVTAFFVRRLFRIVPMFWLSIPIYVCMMNIGGYEFETLQVICAAFFLQAARPDWITAAIVPGAWSVCVEVVFYCAFPLIAAYVNSLLRAIALGIACFAIAILWADHGLAAGMLLFPHFNSGEINLWAILSFPAQLPAFAVGILCFFLIPDWKYFVGRAATEMLLAGALLYCVYLAVSSPFVVPEWSLAFGMIAICLANGAGRYLIYSSVILIGRFSFSIYLLHWIAMGRAVEVGNALHASGYLRFVTIFLAAVAITTALSAVTYYLVELPMIKLGSRYLARRALIAPLAVTVAADDVVEQVR